MAPENRSRLKYWLLFGSIPTLAILIALRQGYFNAHYHLSTWKGGGMGMFAGADNGDTRFTRIYIELPSGQRQPVTKLTAGQDRLRERLLWYPSPHAFRDLALSIRATKLVAADDQVPVYRLSSAGKRLGATGATYYQLNAAGPRAVGDDPDWTLIIEYWETSFDAKTRLVRAELVQTARFPKGEL